MSNILTVGQIRASLGSSQTPSDFRDNLPAVGTVSIPQSPPLDARQWNIRVDHNFNGYKDRIYLSQFRTTSEATIADPRPLYTYISPNAGVYAKLSWTRTTTPNLINQAWFTYVHADGGFTRCIDHGDALDHNEWLSPRKRAQKSVQEDQAHSHAGRDLHF